MSESAYVSGSLSGFRDLVDCRVHLQPVLSALNHMPTPFSRPSDSVSLSATEQSVAELFRAFLELQLAGYPASSLPRGLCPVDGEAGISDLWTQLLAPLNEASFSWCLREAEHWRHSTRISKATDLKTLEAPFAEQLHFALADPDRKFLRKFQPPLGKYSACPDVAQVFDDTLFYAALLKDASSSAAAAGTGAGAGAGVVDVKSMNKPRLAPAYRAAKGRRLSAKVMDKLVGFVNPNSQAAAAAAAAEAEAEADAATVDATMRSLFL